MKYMWFVCSICLTEQVAEMIRRPQDISKVLYFKDLGHEELWLEAATRLTAVVQQIIEFAKMVPGFMKLPQDDQIVLLKAGAFELVVLRITRHYDTATNSVLFGETLLPPEAFMTADTTEMKLIETIFEGVRALAELKLTDTQLALYSAFVLLSPGISFIPEEELFQNYLTFNFQTKLSSVLHPCHLKPLVNSTQDMHAFSLFHESDLDAYPHSHNAADRPGLKGTGEISRLGGAVLRALRYETSKTHRHPLKGDVTVVDALLARVPQIR
jgi:hypothetical protein